MGAYSTRTKFACGRRAYRSRRYWLAHCAVNRESAPNSRAAYSDSPAASRAYRFTSLIFLSSVFEAPPVGV
jgi:hypothetical protein